MTHPGDVPIERIGALAHDLRVLSGRLRRRLREHGTVGDLRPSHIATLLRLETLEPATVSALARAEAMRPQSMAPIVAALEAAELVQGAPDPDDGRQVLFSLTPLCRERLQRGRAAREDWLTAAIRARFSAEEQRVLEQAVTLLGRLVEAP